MNLSKKAEIINELIKNAGYSDVYSVKSSTITIAYYKTTEIGKNKGKQNRITDKKRQLTLMKKLGFSNEKDFEKEIQNIYKQTQANKEKIQKHNNTKKTQQKDLEKHNNNTTLERGGNLSDKEEQEYNVAKKMLRKIINFIPKDQYKVLQQDINPEKTEEYKFFQDKVKELHDIIISMPKTYQTDGQENSAIAYLHYFMSGGDWYMTEKDKGDGKIGKDGLGEQVQAFGYNVVDFVEFPYAKNNYFSIPEIDKLHFKFPNPLQLDLYWTPKTLAEIKGFNDNNFLTEDIKEKINNKIDNGIYPENSLERLEKSQKILLENDIKHLGQRVEMQLSNLLKYHSKNTGFLEFYSEIPQHIISAIEPTQAGGLKTNDKEITDNYLKAKEIFKNSKSLNTDKDFRIAWFGLNEFMPLSNIKADGEIKSDSGGLKRYKEDYQITSATIIVEMDNNNLYKISTKYLHLSDKILAKGRYFKDVDNDWLLIFDDYKIVIYLGENKDASYPSILANDKDALYDFAKLFLNDAESYAKEFEILKSVNEKGIIKVLSEEVHNLLNSNNIEPKVEPKTQYEINKAIEQLLKDKKGQQLTKQEKEFISKFSGYGGLFDDADKNGEDYNNKFRYEFFTPPIICETMVKLAIKHGYPNKGSVLEPSAGTGNFLKYFSKETPITTYEINPIQYEVMKILYPNATHHNKAFEYMFLTGAKMRTSVKGKVNNLPKYDLVIGNPPYGKYKSPEAGYGERTYTKADNYIDYFISRGLDVTKQGGLLIFVIGTEPAKGGRLFTDKPMYKAKQLIEEKADLIDGIKLWQGIFARTDVMTEILVFRKK